MPEANKFKVTFSIEMWKNTPKDVRNELYDLISESLQYSELGEIEVERI